MERAFLSNQYRTLVLVMKLVGIARSWIHCSSRRRSSAMHCDSCAVSMIQHSEIWSCYLRRLTSAVSCLTLLIHNLTQSSQHGVTTLRYSSFVADFMSNLRHSFIGEKCTVLFSLPSRKYTLLLICCLLILSESVYILSHMMEAILMSMPERIIFKPHRCWCSRTR